jgi:hypothetical protein
MIRQKYVVVKLTGLRPPIAAYRTSLTDQDFLEEAVDVGWVRTVPGTGTGTVPVEAIEL